MSTANRVIKNTGWLYAKMAITMFVSLYTTRLILNGLGASDFGIFNIVGGAISMLGFVNTSMAGSTQRFMSYATGQGLIDKQKNIFNVSYLIHIGLGVFAVFVFVAAGYWFFNGLLNIPEDRQMAAIVVYGCLIVSTFFTMISVPYEAVMNAHENMKYYAVVGIIESLLKLSVAFAVIYSPIDKLIYYGILMSLIPIVVLSIMRVYCHRYYNECEISFCKYWDKSLAKEMATFAGWGLTSSVASLLTMQGISILLNIFGGVVVNAAHAVANQLAGQLMVFSNNLIKALNPVLVKSYGAGDNEKMLEAASTGNKMSFLVFSVFAIPFIVEAPAILKIWLKEPPEFSVLFIRLVLIRQMLSQMMIAFETCISATGKIKNFTIIASVIWISPLIISYVLYKNGAPIETIYWILIATALCRIANSLYFCKKLCGLRWKQYIIHTLLPCILSVAVSMSTIGIICNNINVFVYRIIVVSISMIIIYPALSYYIILEEKERKFVNDLINKYIRKK